MYIVFRNNYNRIFACLNFMLYLSSEKKITLGEKYSIVKIIAFLEHSFCYVLSAISFTVDRICYAHLFLLTR